MTFKEEPEWMRKARTVPLRSTYDSRQPPEPASEENRKAGRKEAMS